MAKILETLIPLALLLATAQSSTYFSYDFSSNQQDSLLYQGDAHFPSDSSAYLRLTKTNFFGYPETNSVGRVLYSEPVKFPSDGEKLDFATSITFKITAVDNTPADGLAFFIAPFGTAIPAGSAGGRFGVFGPMYVSNVQVVAIEFDTYFNQGWDSLYSPHVGIDIEGPVSSNVTVIGNSLIGQEVSAFISYEHKSKKIIVSVTAGSESFVVSYVRDLSGLIPEIAQVGISASTGTSVAIHDVASWDFFSFDDGVNGAKIRQVIV